MTCLKPFLSLALIALVSPAFAQMDMSLLPEEPSSSSEEMMSLSIEESSSEEPSSSKMSGPPEFSSSSSEIVNSISNEAVVPPTPVDVKATFELFLETCQSLSGGDPAGFDKANDAGWVPYDGVEYGPYKRVYSGSRDVEAYGAVELWGSYETYPSQSLGYCRVDFGDYETTFDLTQIAGIGGLNGAVDATGTYGTWETADKKLLVIAARVEGSLSIEFNVLVGDTPAP